MKIVVVARHYWPSPGAATVRLQALVRAFLARGDQVSVITRGHPEESQSSGPLGERLVCIPGDSATGVGLKRVHELVRFSAGARRVIREIAPDLVIADPPATSALASSAHPNAARVYYMADSWSDMLSEGGGRLARVLSSLVRPLERRALRGSDVVIAVRENLADLARQSGARQVITAPYGTDLSVFRFAGPGWSDPWKGDVPYFLYAGNFGVVHGATIFLDAAERMWRNGLRFGLVFMGYGSDLDVIAAFRDRQPNYFHLLPMQEPEVAASAFRGAVAALVSTRPLNVTSQTRPAKALAALACGCPVVFAGDGAFAAEVGSAELGLSAPWSSEPVAAAMESMLTHSKDHPAEYAALRHKIAAYAGTNFDISRSAADLVDRITGALEAHREARRPTHPR
jgi:glycosyltransferase involved in cell wall biosynthesis